MASSFPAAVVVDHDGVWLDVVLVIGLLVVLVFGWAWSVQAGRVALRVFARVPPVAVTVTRRFTPALQWAVRPVAATRCMTTAAAPAAAAPAGGDAPAAVEPPGDDLTNRPPGAWLPVVVHPATHGGLECGRWRWRCPTHATRNAGMRRGRGCVQACVCGGKGWG